MSHNQAPQARLTTLAQFPAKYFLESLAVRQDNSVLVTAMNDKELWYVPPQEGDEEVEAVCIHTFEQPTTGIVEVEPDIFLVFTSNLYTTHESYAHRLDLRSWEPGSPATPKLLCRFPEIARVSMAAVCSRPAWFWLRTVRQPHLEAGPRWGQQCSRHPRVA